MNWSIEPLNRNLSRAALFLLVVAAVLAHASSGEGFAAATSGYLTPVPGRVAAPGIAPMAAPGVALTSAPATEPADAPGEAAGQAGRRAFGYRVGEERRYILGPEDALRRGEIGAWLIRLDETEGEGESFKATFSLSHERSTTYMDLLSQGKADIFFIRVETVLTVNAYGFPLKVVITEQQDLGERAIESDLRTSIYTFNGEGYTKQVRLSGRNWEFDVHIANHRELDVEVPRGLFLYLPTGLRCLGLRTNTIEYDPFEYREGCDWSDPAMGNPGLISLLIPELWETEDAKKEFLFFTPVTMGTRPAGLINQGQWLRQERDRLSNTQRYWERMKLEVKELVEIKVGPRTLEAWKMDLWNDVYVDRYGKVLRVDLDPNPQYSKDRWIRIQFASEY